MSLSNDCSWPGNDVPYRQYHDQVWGVPQFDSEQLFAQLCLEGQQAGLSWLTILRKKSNFESAFAEFKPQVLQRWGEPEIAALMGNAGIIRSRLKIKAIIDNAKAYQQIELEAGDFAKWLWSFVNQQQVVNHYRSSEEGPTQTLESQLMAKALKKAGFKFVGPTICYAFMQAVGMVNDHLVSCSCHANCTISATDYPWSV